MREQRIQNRIIELQIRKQKDYDSNFKKHLQWMDPQTLRSTTDLKASRLKQSEARNQTNNSLKAK